jgi:uncharacterized LabA/DUF88 family protein
MDRVAFFVDAGYLFAQGSILITGEKLPRGEILFNIPKAIEALQQFASKEAKVPLLRIYWYDGTATGPSSQHMALAIKPNVKVRLGFVNTVGEQKGVDSLIVTDMITLARNRAMSDAILLSGDEDLRVGVQLVQEFGIRVHLLGIQSHSSIPHKRSQSQFLLQEADSTHMWCEKDISGFISRSSRPALPSIGTKPIELKPVPSAQKAASADATLTDVAKKVAAEIDAGVIEGLLTGYESTKQIPSEIDRPLLGAARRQYGTMAPDQKNQLRQDFMAALKARLPNPTGKKTA